uniref:Uncharacterized protein LOC111138410 n=1 Tax=Crassostrea virginica TaxID=6565 RepID=A0A8B8F1G3_CRAVI|nr:uncharacterized protein LOC111138410 [Crassostrea virginica]XP_022346071.1 uncharacterized protein LOC111138410 [Crassostrea virginica]
MLPAPAHRIQIDYMLPSHQPTGQGNYPIQPLNYPLGGPPPMMNTPQSVMNYAGGPPPMTNMPQPVVNYAGPPPTMTMPQSVMNYAEPMRARRANRGNRGRSNRRGRGAFTLSGCLTNLSLQDDSDNESLCSETSQSGRGGRGGKFQRGGGGRGRGKEVLFQRSIPTEVEKR